MLIITIFNNKISVNFSLKFRNFVGLNFTMKAFFFNGNSIGNLKITAAEYQMNLGIPAKVQLMTALENSKAKHHYTESFNALQLLL